MRSEPANRLNRKALSVWRISSGITMFIFFIVGIAFLSFSIILNVALWVSFVIIGFVIVLSIFFVGIYPHLQWKKWRYDVHETEIDLQHGVFIVKRTLVPMVRVQHVDTQQGPLLRRFKLASVTISTAATIHEIPALGEVEADELRDRISQLAKVVEQNE